MTRRRMRAALLVAVFASSLGLAGCVAGGGAAPPSPAASAHPAASRTPASAATRAPAPTAAPVARFGIPCSELVEPSAIGYPVAATPIGGDTVDDLMLGLDGGLQASAAQLGLLQCDWGTSTGAVGSGPELTVSALVGQQAVAQKDVAAIRSSGGVALGVGEDSAGVCFASPFDCYGEARAGQFWFYVALAGQPSGTTLDAAQGMTVLRAVASAVDARLAQTVPTAAWAPATAPAWTGGAPCSSLGALAGLTRAVASGSWVQGEEAGDQDGPVTTAYNGDRLSCVWQPQAMRADGTGPSVDVDIVPGATWAWPLLSGAAGITSTPIAVAGADAADYRCQQAATLGTQCWADAVAGGSWLQVHFEYESDSTPQRTAAVLAAIIAGRGV